ncbi:hypothetical protein SCLCIDRAFT_314046 [Scleroderma citrinum Foug A]|uniref:Uncharacterized protein n=1 Tax=Scleroderma citrinum Foug A TaxID=1036808 RepID=A0A0C2ZRB0_9AGAM|nr:hypothetical protein SCLCIDRAFT_314046 [Scleroderma citrinum Foug A]
MPTSPVPHLSAAPVPAQSIGALSRLFDKSALFFPGCTGLVTSSFTQTLGESSYKRCLSRSTMLYSLVQECMKVPITASLFQRVGQLMLLCLFPLDCATVFRTGCLKVLMRYDC